ncbi:PIG-L family deacetylase [Embleya scabrispora]|uniref:PIG-L family deacetylase n=1 Tax=Embleya scabrispora TaxID=159449 RepID=UPI00037F4C2A|nr:PIG-L family deacetylase [Embleya scabrispora]MYS86928.1 PIG-L family deacetylase [Streptomyces sp. SID5474]
MSFSAEEDIYAPDGFMQIAAHPDDDLYFMDPEMIEGIRAGVASTSVFLTAGEIQDPLHTRQLGLMAAHAEAAQVTTPTWTGTALGVPTSLVEVFTLDQRPNVRLVFMNLPDGTSLPGLAAGTSSAQTVNPQSATTGVNTTYTYTRAQLLTALVTLFDHFRPGALRILDALPDPRYASDHLDHTSAAKLANDAVAQYQTSTGRRILVTSYRGYNTGNSPDDISASEQAAKTAVLLSYTNIATHGATTSGWGKPQYVRWARGSRWVGRNADNTLQAFAVVGTQVLFWRQATDGTWGSAQSLPSPGGPLAPGLSVANNPDGRLQVVGRRLDNHQITTIHQTSVNGAFATSWSNFGNPNDIAAPANKPRIGTPILVRNQDGLLQIFVKNGGGGVSTVVQTNPVSGAWNLTWADLGGSGLQDELAAVVGYAGRIELFGYALDNYRNGLLCAWYQSAVKTVANYTSPLVASNVASGPTPVRNADGRIQVFYREDATANVAVLTQSSAGGPWSTGPTNLGGDGGTREIGAITALSDGRILLYARNASGGVSVCWQTAPNAGFGSWTALAGTTVDTPAAGYGPDGRIVLFRFGTDANLYAAAQTTSTPGAPFAGWQSLG